MLRVKTLDLRWAAGDSPPLAGEGEWGGGVGENKKQSIVVAGLFSYWGGGGRLWYAWVLAGQHMLVWGARSCTLSLSLAAAAQTFPVHTTRGPFARPAP